MIHWGTIKTEAAGAMFSLIHRRIRYIAIGNLVICWYARDRG